MERKSVALELKADKEGSFRAVFSAFDVIDKDGDVTRPDAFSKGQPVRIAQWGHNWGALPVGKGTLDLDAKSAWVDGQFFLDTQAGADTYRTVKNLGALQEWSFGFNVTKHSFGDFDGQKVRFLEAIDTFEVSPVMLGAGVGTHTEFVKSAATLDERLANLATSFVADAAYLDHYIDMRAEKGRSLSAGARESLKQLQEAIAGAGVVFERALRDIESDPKAADPLAEFVRFQQLRARHLGVAI